jgi:hypothetical protein
VAGSCDRADPESTEIDILAVIERHVPEGEAGVARRKDLCTGGSELAAARHEVGVEMRLDRMSQPDAAISRGGQELLDVARRIDHQSSAVTDLDEV